MPWKEPDVPIEEKFKAARRLAAGEDADALARELGVRTTDLCARAGSEIAERGLALLSRVHAPIDAAEAHDGRIPVPRR